MDLFELAITKKIFGGGTGGGTGGGVVEEKQIIFIDYDGTLLYSYTPEEVLALTELPSHTSTDELLIFDGWNWTLEELKEEINLIGLDFMQHHKMAVGATYRTIDGATYYLVDITADDESQRTITVRIKVGRDEPVTIDWGDGSEPDTLTTTSSYGSDIAKSHTFAKGSYAIKIDCAEGHDYSTGYEGFGVYVNYNAIRSSTLKKVHFGDRLWSIPRTAFTNCYNLTAVSFPNRSIRFVESGFVESCPSLKALVFGKANYLPENTAKFCGGLETISIPPRVKGVGTPYTGSSSAYFVQGCPNLAIAHIPVGTSIDGAFYDCLFLESAYISKVRDALSIGAFTSCKKLNHIKIADGVASIMKYCFSNNYSLSNVSIPSTVTTLKSNCFDYCGALKKIKIPKSVASIEASAFYYCGSLVEVDMTEHESVPTLASTNVFTNTNSALKILVPASLYDEWIAATNWSSSSVASKIVAVEV